MFSRKLTATLAVLAATAATGLSAAAASAAVVDNDSVKITTTGFDFGNGTYLGAGPTGSGDLDWLYSDGRYSAHLTGSLWLNNVNGSCARMRMEYFDDGVSLDTEHGGTVCSDDNKLHGFDVDLNPYSDDDTDLVKVSVEKETAGGWSIAESSYFSPDIPSDKVKITSSGADFGDDAWLVNAPTGSGDLYWNRGENGDITPRLIGTVHLNDVDGLCARMNLRYYSDSGAYLTHETGGTVCSPDDGHNAWSVDLSPYTSNQLGSVKVQLETQNTNGSWTVAGSDTVKIAA